VPAPDRGSRLALTLAALVPALAAGAAVLSLGSGGGEGNAAGSAGAADQLARAADRGKGAIDPAATTRALAPVIAEPGRAGIEASPLESLDGGIRPAPPQRIAIPAAGLDAVVEPVSSRGGAIKVPDVGRAGWYDGGPRPGEIGRALIIGHLDRRKGPGLFARVPSLLPGTDIDLTDRRGEVRRFKVVGTTQTPKDRFPTQYVYGAADAPVLVLVTCGGPFRPGRGYRDNVLLYARLAERTTPRGRAPRVVLYRGGP